MKAPRFIAHKLRHVAKRIRRWIIKSETVDFVLAIILTPLVIVIRLWEWFRSDFTALINEYRDFPDMVDEPEN